MEGTLVREVDVGIIVKFVDILGVIGFDFIEVDIDTVVGVILLYFCIVVFFIVFIIGERIFDIFIELEKNLLFLYIIYKFIEFFSVRNFFS